MIPCTSKGEVYNPLEPQSNILVKLAAERGDMEAQFERGLLYQYGRNNVNQDIMMAAKWYERAAAQGHTTAKENLREIYVEMKGDVSSDAPSPEM